MRVKMRVSTWWHLPDKGGVIRKIRLEKGKDYDVRPEDGQRWISRGLAAEVVEEKEKDKEVKK